MLRLFKHRLFLFLSQLAYQMERDRGESLQGHSCSLYSSIHYNNTLLLSYTHSTADVQLSEACRDLPGFSH